MRGRLRWLSHAGFIITSPNGKIIIIDPWIKDNPLCPITLDSIDKVDIVLVTHDHFDHLGNAVDIVKKTGATIVVAPETAVKLQSEMGVSSENIIFGGYGMNIGGSANIDGINITMTQALHSCETACPTGFIIRLEDGYTIYHAGDTGIFESMRLFGEIYQVDLALIPIGSVFVMDPYQAAHSLRLIRPKRAIPMHYKTFPILEQNADNFVKLANQIAPDVKVIVLNPGDSFMLA